MDEMKTASLKSKRKVMASSSRLPVCGSAKDLKALWHLAEAEHVLTSRRSHGSQVEMDSLGGLDLKTIMQGRFPGLGLKTEGTSGAAGWR
jgi:hypothetical protein